MREYSYLPSLSFCLGVSRTNDEISEISHFPFHSRTRVQNLPHSDIFTRNGISRDFSLLSIEGEQTMMVICLFGE